METEQREGGAKKVQKWRQERDEREQRGLVREREAGMERLEKE